MYEICGFLLELLQAHDLASNNDTILLVVIPATSCRDVAASRALKLAQELDSDGEHVSLFDVARHNNCA